MNVEKIIPILASPKKIAITTHFKPDGDAIGSSLGLYNYLIQQGHAVTVVAPSDYPEFLQWMAGNDKVIDAIGKPKEAEQAMNEAEVIFCLDFNMLHRCESVAPWVSKSKAVKILIDHHLHPDSFCDFIFSDTEAAATAELVYNFIAALGGKKQINKSVAECLYVGIMTDTASFRFPMMKAETHRIIAKLMEAGAENFRIHEHVYDSWNEDRIRLLAYCTNEKMTVMHEFNTAIIQLTSDELKRFNHKTGDTEGIVNIPLSIKTIRFSAFFVQRRDIIKISFRSKDNFNVRDLSNKYFKGGGHMNASGGMSELSMEETIKKFKSILPEYKNELTK